MRILHFKQLLLPILTLFLIAGFPASVSLAAPQLPHYFYGTVSIDGQPAPVGTIIEAKGTNVVNADFNPITTTEAGHYGSSDPLADVPRLLVQGSSDNNIEDGTIITFFVNGVQANETASYVPGGVTELNLTTSSGSTPPADTGNQTSPDTNQPPADLCLQPTHDPS